jgi:hypothetical protein
MDMVRYASKSDPGYIAVSDQLWIWVDEITQSSASSLPPLDEIRQARQAMFGGDQGDGSQFIVRGSINSGGGSVFVGNQTASGDITNGFGRPNA